MTLLDTRLRATAETLIAKFGKAMTLRRAVEGTYDTATATAPVVTSDYAVVGVVTRPSDAMLSAGLALAADLVVLLAAKAMTVTPEAGDTLLIDGVTWQTMSVRSMFSGEQVATYELLTRS